MDRKCLFLFYPSQLFARLFLIFINHTPYKFTIFIPKTPIVIAPSKIFHFIFFNPWTQISRTIVFWVWILP